MVPKCECAAQWSGGGLSKHKLLGPPSSPRPSVWFSRSRTGPKNLHFWPTYRWCWDAGPRAAHWEPLEQTTWLTSLACLDPICLPERNSWMPPSRVFGRPRPGLNGNNKSLSYIHFHIRSDCMSESSGGAFENCHEAWVPPPENLTKLVCVEAWAKPALPSPLPKAVA